MIAMAVACVLVALVVRDVALRVLADRAAQRLSDSTVGRLDGALAQVWAALDGETKRLSEARAQVNGVDEALVAVTRDLSEVKAKLNMMQGMR